MSNYSPERLYQLLPAVYRQRDADQGYPLRDLVEIIAAQAQILERDILELADNWFIETCEPWLVPYIGDLIGVRGTHGVTGRRAEVANTLGYRRAKGTAAVLEQMARDVTGWPARVVEYFERLDTTQYLNHVRLHNLRTPNLRDANALELLNGPFETANHTVEVRRIAPRRGRYNIPNVGLFLFRLQAYPLEAVKPHMEDQAPNSVTDKTFTFNVLGMDEPLFHHPEAETAASHIAEEINVPLPIRRRALYAAFTRYYGTSFVIYVNHAALPAAQLQVCNLTDWKNLPQTGGKVAVDPVLGRIAFPDATDPAKVRVTYHYGFSDDLGSGLYEREPSFTSIEVEPHIKVGETETNKTIQAALDAWNGAGSAVIEIVDSGTYAEDPEIKKPIPEKSRLEIRAVNERRPTLLLTKELLIYGKADSRFEVNGLLIAGGTLRVPPKNPDASANQLDGLRIQHTTLAPARSSPALSIEAGETEVTIERSILGPIRTAAETELDIRDSVVDAADKDGKVLVAAYEGVGGTGPGGPLRVSRCTVIGEVKTRQLTLAENSIFLHRVSVEQRQVGCVRFSFLPFDSRTPRRYRCQPTAKNLAAMRPRFTSLRYGHPGYCQLTLDTPVEIRRGAEDESEMGVFSSLRQPQREDALRIRLDEYLRVGLEAGIFFQT